MSINSQVINEYVNNLEIKHKELAEKIKYLQIRIAEYEAIVRPVYPAYPQSLEYWQKAYGKLREHFEAVISEKVLVHDLIEKGEIIKFNGKFTVNFE